MKIKYSIANQNLQCFKCTMPSILIAIPLFCVHGKTASKHKKKSKPRIQRFSTECRKTKTKVITLTNHKGHRPHNEQINQIKAQSNDI